MLCSGQADLAELINTPIEDDGLTMDIDNDGNKSISDSDIKAFLLSGISFVNLIHSEKQNWGYFTLFLIRL